MRRGASPHARHAPRPEDLAALQARRIRASEQAVEVEIGRESASARHPASDPHVRRRRMPAAAALSSPMPPNLADTSSSSSSV
eukprot:CAMPEP_0113678998 /NCGR_PEP_ID=MMETSP0038_2-20120614/10314_1 /TAXON_ID=2898 /ORGANISM="Cryptomonas paramecium" /LENGTH=82 /DNA_ID=CAMNT_0000596809 /DNA_START=61 /DNA_END=310 /DNA_ORIENTATION=+ /assembly_acc=CAM_ASM_000170